MRIYIESTIPSFLTARPSADSHVRSQQEITRAWWNGARLAHELFISDIVIDEISRGDIGAAQRRLEVVEDIEILVSPPGVDVLIKAIIGSGLLPSFAYADASHIALASMHNLDILLSWNCRHIANAAIQSRLRRIVDDHGLSMPTICTPYEIP